ncbi:chloride channel protein [Amylibacter sp.]|nr:chloride channel protein [Amylibacter sp.]
MQFWIIALLIGIASGLATLVFRLAITYLQFFSYGESGISLTDAVSQLPWFTVMIIPITGGLIVGIILNIFTKDGRARSVGHVIEGAALYEGRVEGKAGLASSFASVITLSTGGSTGREGPVVLLGSLISSKVSRWINADGITGRNLMGCAVAAAVSASFNAPLAGALFALEVVLRHYAIQALAPILIASVAGTVISRLYFGNVTEFTLPVHTQDFYIELPAHLLLGIVCAFVAVSFIKSVFWAESLGDKIQRILRIPNWSRPAFAGALLGLIAIKFPHIIGVGYETMSLALNGNLLFWTAISFAFAKGLAVVITLAGRMGGGIFSPSLMLGALTGLAFGWIAVSIFPSVDGDETLYAISGMGAVAAAILGAPISTILIVIELTGDWQAGLAVMVAVSIATAFTSKMIHRSFFLTQLERRGVNLSEGPHSYLLAKYKVVSIMNSYEKTNLDEKYLWQMIEQGQYLDIGANLEAAMPMFQNGECEYLPVLSIGPEKNSTKLVGVLYYIDALKTFNQALFDTSKEEHS